LRLERAELLRVTEEIVEEDRRRKEAERTRRLNYIDKQMEPSRLALSRKASDLESRLDALNAVPRSRMADSAQDRFGRDRRRLLNDWDEYKGELSAWKEHLRALENEVFSELGG
jgi:RNA polymerase-binding transcription factor DksA